MTSLYSLVKKPYRLLALTAAWAVGCSLPAGAQDKVFPANAGLLNVKSAPYNAAGNGTTDDTQAIQRALADAINSHRLVYLPNGTYRVSNTLKWNNGSADNGGWGAFMSLQGQSRTGTIIKLANGTFPNAASPQAVLMTGSRDDGGRYNDGNGEGNQAFENSISDLTIDVGEGNAGAIGVDYQVSNWGALRNVTIRSSDPNKAGFCGVSLLRRDNGPGLIDKVSVDGFQYGIRAGQEIAQFTLENITLTSQSVVGLEDRDAIMAVRKLTSVNSVPAVRVSGNALLNLLEANLTGGATAGSAIEFTGDGRGYVRGITSSGYASALRRNGNVVAGAAVSEWVSDPVLRTNTSAQLSLNLPIEETPEYFDSNLGNWADVGPATGGNDAPAIQAAMNSGKSTVYFRAGRYRYNTTITVPPSVKHIIGLGAVLVPTGNMGGNSLFRFVGGTSSDQTLLERFELNNDNGHIIEHASPRTLVVRNIGMFGGSGYRNQQGAGKLFVSDVAIGHFDFFFPQQAWCRQYNCEGGPPITVSNGATLWILGFKTENAATFMEAKNGSRIEMFAGLTYSFGDSGQPAIDNENSQVSASFAGTTYVPNGSYSTLVRERSGTAVATIPRSSAYGGRTYSVPMYVGALPSPLDVKAPANSAAREARLQAYPNPSAGAATIAYTPARSEAVALELYDLQGRLVKRIFAGAAEKGVRQEYLLSKEALPSGMYLIQLATPSETISRKWTLVK